MNEIVSALIAGVLFGLGLCVSGMADPAVVQGFLDLAGDWNPALLFVMAAGLAVTLIGYRLVFGGGHPFWASNFHLPAATAIDAPLMSGAVLFGIGWGLAGYCPGPAVVSLASGWTEVFIFVAAMLAGMIVVRWLRTRPLIRIAKPPLEKGA